VEVLVLLLGLVMLAYSAMLEVSKRLLLLPLLVVALLPGLYGAVSTVTGASGQDIMLGAFVPLYLVIGLYGLFRLPVLLRGNIKPAVAVGVLLVLGTAVQAGVYVKQDMASRREMQAWQDRYRGLVKYVESDQSRGTCVTDRPGFPAFLDRQRVVDLAGRSCLEVLYCVGEYGQLDTEKTLDLITDRQADLLILWEEQNYLLVSRLEQRIGNAAVLDLSGAGGSPLIYRIDWSRVLAE
jgi:hypothetical protein